MTWLGLENASGSLRLTAGFQMSEYRSDAILQKTRLNLSSSSSRFGLLANEIVHSADK
jgi:hypothetical protein